METASFSLYTQHSSVQLFIHHIYTHNLHAQPLLLSLLSKSTPCVFNPPRLRELSANWSSGMRLAMAWKSSLTLCAVLADVSKNSNPHSSAYSWAVYQCACTCCKSNCILSVCLPWILSPWFRWLVLLPDRICCLLMQWQCWDLLDVAIHSPRLLLFPRKTMMVICFSHRTEIYSLINRYSRLVWYHKQLRHNWHCDSTWELSSCISLVQPCPYVMS